ncbi:MAG TPA: Type 1 glutamine amidotransferase-like domain-containing protein [Thermoanaerobaculia bacterium]|nr:Type 1 glutamine amidotransferase-like domain-containing protein [Thermoanaerobaculia bacterium]
MATPLTLALATPVHLLVLIGGGEFSFGETRAIDEFLLSRMPADRRTVAFLPTASGSPEYATHIGKYFGEIDPSVRTINVPVYRGRDNRRQKNLHMLLSAGMIYVGGGVTNQLLATLRQSPAEMAMRDAAKNGAVIAAIGAAASSFGVRARNMSGAGALDGLGWLAGTVVETGFEPDDDVPLRRLMSLPDIDIGLGIPPRAAVAIGPDGTTQILGEGRVAVFRKP